MQERERHMPPDLAGVHRRIQDVVGVLMDFRSRRDGVHSRSDYMERLIDDVSNYYGYVPELVSPPPLPHHDHRHRHESAPGAHPRPL